MIVRIVLILAALCYYASFVLSLEKIKNRLNRPLVGKIVYIAGCCANIGVILYNYISNIEQRGVFYVPFVSVRQVMIFLALCFLPVRLFISKVCKCKGYDGYFLLAAAVFLTAPCFMDAGAVNFPPALQSVFFIPHIFCYMLSYALSAVGFLITLTALVKKEDHDDVIVSIIRVLFPFMTAGLACGAVWADQVWGEFWAWDIKECWSLVTWLDYMLCLHLFKRAKLKKAARILVLTGFVLVMITFLFSNVLNVHSVHSY